MIRPLPPAPSRDNPGPFASQSDALLAALAGFVEDGNRLEQSLIFVGTTGQSATPLAVGAGTKTLTASTGKAWVIGAWLHLVSAGGIGNVMVGQVLAYDVDTGGLQVNVGAFAGSGTHSDWLIGLSSPQAPITAALIASGAIAARVSADGGLMLPGNAANALGAVPLQQVQLLVAGALPAGTEIEFGGTSAPTGFVKLNGSVPLVSSVPNLVANVYCGDANNASASFYYRCTDPLNPNTTRSTTGAYFVLKNARGRFRRALSDGDTLDAGRSAWAYQDDAFQGHSHNAYMTGTVTTGGDPAIEDGPRTGTSSSAILGPANDGTNGNPRTAPETRPSNYASLVCVKI